MPFLAHHRSPKSRIIVAESLKCYFKSDCHFNIPKIGCRISYVKLKYSILAMYGLIRTKFFESRGRQPLKIIFAPK